MKMSVALMGFCATAALGFGTAGTATARPAMPTPMVYLHGTAHMAHFASWSTCQVYATGTAKTVAKSGRLVSGDVARAKCYPLQNGRWSYIVAYLSTRPVFTSDLDDDTAATTTGDSLWSFEHYRRGPASTFPHAKCEADRKSYANRIIAGKNVRLLDAGMCRPSPESKSWSYVSTYPVTRLTRGFPATTGHR